MKDFPYFCSAVCNYEDGNIELNLIIEQSWANLIIKPCQTANQARDKNCEWSRKCRPSCETCLTGARPSLPSTMYAPGNIGWYLATYLQRLLPNWPRLYQQAGDHRQEPRWTQGGRPGLDSLQAAEGGDRQRPDLCRAATETSVLLLGRPGV